MRSAFNSDAMVNWYRLLWHMIQNGDFVNKNGIGIENGTAPDIRKFERELFKILHCHERDDVTVVVCVMKVWALARLIVDGPGSLGSFLSFNDIEGSAGDGQREGQIENIEHGIAFLCGPPVAEYLIPPLYRQNPPLGMPGVELTDTGILILFAIWHERLIEQVCVNVPVLATVFNAENAESAVSTAESTVSTAEIAENTTPLGDDDYRLLDRILGMENVPLQSIFSLYSKPNPFTLIKHSGLDFSTQTKMAGTLFDHEPSLYKDSLLGRLLLLAHSRKLVFLLNDEILGFLGGFLGGDERGGAVEGGGAMNAIWLFYSLEKKFAAPVVNGRIMVLVPFGPNVVDFIAAQLRV